MLHTEVITDMASIIRSIISGEGTALQRRKAWSGYGRDILILSGE